MRLQAVRPVELLARAADSAAPSLVGAGVTVQVQDAAEDCWVMVDGDRLHEALTNLVANAVRHTPPGGAVRLRSSSTGSTVDLEVVDTGEGIEPEHLPRVFERFYRVDHGRTGGTGVGLTITRALVEAHGGRVRARSPGPGRGASFVITLPRWHDSSPGKG